MTKTDFLSKQIIIISKGNKLSFKNDNLIVTDEEGKILLQTTCYRLFSVFVIGYHSVTSGLIQRAEKFGFSIIMMTPSFRPYLVISRIAEANVLLRRKQYDYHGSEAARILTENKMKNQRELLMSIRGKTKKQAEAVRLIDGYIASLSSAEDIAGIMGLEGCASRIYFSAWFDNVPWNGRKPRIKFDMVNALLDIGYTILFNYLDAVASVFGFDRYWGILHRQFYMRKSLICDFVEPFRVIIDRTVKKGINLKQFQEKDFEVINSKYCLAYKNSGIYAAIFFQEINKYREEIFIYVRDYYRAMMKGTLDISMPRWGL